MVLLENDAARKQPKFTWSSGAWSTTGRLPSFIACSIIAKVYQPILRANLFAHVALFPQRLTARSDLHYLAFVLARRFRHGR